MIVGITGSIATGKSVAGSYFKEKGYDVINTDLINKELLEQKKHIKNINKLLFNIKSNVLNKLEVSKLIFSDQTKKKTLEDYLHPIIYEIVKKKLKSIKKRPVFIEVPLLFETNFVDLCDKILVVYTDEDTQINRLIKRDHITKTEAKKRISAQMALSEKIKLADYKVDNSNTLEETYQSLDQIIDALLKEEK